MNATDQIEQLKQARQNAAKWLTMAQKAYHRSERYRKRLIAARLRLMEYREAEERRSEGL